MSQTRVMHIVDTLDLAGRERMAVNLANLLPRDEYLVYLCTTRRDGPLADLIEKDVNRLRLNRRRRFDIEAINHLIRFIRSHNIQILHAHSESLFIACMASMLPPHPAVIWHDHYGEYATKKRLAWPYRLVAGRMRGVIAVNHQLAEWSRSKLHLPSERIWYIPNFVSVDSSPKASSAIPGKTGRRIVCVANLRAQKDHLTLLRAMSLVIRHVPEAHLLQVGASSDQVYFDRVRKEIMQLGLDQNVSLLGERKDVFTILQSSDIGVLSSASEGLPLALLEYGMASLAVVATNVGQCSEVLDGGRAGLLVPKGSHDQLAEAMISLLQSPERRLELGRCLYRRVQDVYGAETVIRQVCQIYRMVLADGKRANPNG